MVTRISSELKIYGFKYRYYYYGTYDKLSNDHASNSGRIIYMQRLDHIGSRNARKKMQKTIPICEAQDGHYYIVDQFIKIYQRQSINQG